MLNLPTGISKRGTKYKWELMRGGKRYAGYCDTLDEAVSAREAQGKSVIGCSDNATLLQVFKALLATEWSEANCKSHEWFSRNSRIICEFFGENTPIANISQTDVTEFVIYLREKKHNANGTINRKLAALSKAFNYAMEAGFMEHRPVTKRQKEPVGRIRFLSEAEEKELVDFLFNQGYTQAAHAVIVLIDTGIRCGELYKLTRNDIDFDKRVVILKDTKNGSNRAVPLTKRAVHSLVELLNLSDDKIHVTPRKTDWMRYAWEVAKNSLGHGDDDCYVPHILRHTCASRLVQKGAPMYTVAAWLGHKTLSTTRRYAHLRPDDVLGLVGLLEKES